MQGAAMATAEKAPTTRNGKPLLPPDERFWKRYSPHFELPLASATSLFLHGLAIGILAIGGIAFLFSGGVEASRPPQMDIVLVDGGVGFGDPGGAPAGEPGFPGDPGKQELFPGTPGPSEPANQGTDSGFEDLPPLPQASLDLRPSDMATDPESSTLLDTLNKINEDASKRSQTAPSASGPAKTGTAKKSGSSGTGNPKGVGGANGPGGIGTGKKPGPGRGGDGGIGRKATEAEVKAWRWRFDLSGGPREHADKLEKAGVIVAIPDPKAGNMDPKVAPLLVIADLKLRPVKLRPAAANEFADAVKWFNTRPESVQGLAQELRLQQLRMPQPPYIVLLLPKERENKMAAEEARYAQQHGNNVATLRETLFDFRLQNGVYEPVVLGQK
jgi:hypothetical protein